MNWAINRKFLCDVILEGRAVPAGKLMVETDSPYLAPVPFRGKTNTPEFGFGPNTVNAVFGATRNPYDLGKTCGGSGVGRRQR